MNPFLYVDYYKTEHHRMLPPGTTLIYSNLTARKSRIKGVNEVVFFGLQHFIKKYLLGKFQENFFDRPWEELDEEYKRHVPVETTHLKKLHELGYLPLKIKAVAEGTLVPIGVPCLTIRNTHPDFAWLTNYFETLLSCQMWQPITSATIAYNFRKLLDKWALKTTGSTEFVQWQGHDFSMRGMPGLEGAILSGMGHLTSFTGTDTIPAIYALEKSYNATGLIGASVPATEHSVMSMGQKESEIDTFRRLLSIYPTGILSVVSDTWDLWKVLTEYLPALKSEILAREGKLVIRPDSGDPVDIICGTSYCEDVIDEAVKTLGRIASRVKERQKGSPIEKGVIELLWDVFGGTVNEQGYKVLDPHIGAIYGDSITMERAEEICKRLEANGFASTNIVLGIGSMTYTGGEITPGKQYWITRDLFGFAVKATYGEVNEVGREIFKDPITDDGTKKSKKGLLYVGEDNGELFCNDQCNWDMESRGLLRTVFKDGRLVEETTLEDIRKRLQQKQTELV